MLTRAPKGTKDVLPFDTYKWQYIENMIRQLTDLAGYREIRTPTFEHTELFERGVGGTTDIVQKEMYTFQDKGGRSITLKPEGTAGAVRAYIENGLFSKPQPIKMYYLTPVFRYENPQSGRLREHHQFGVEVFGSQDASIDAEIILLAITLFKRLGLNELALNINSIGCPKCRPLYHEALKSYLKDRLDCLCDTCRARFEKNPLRILDCKEEKCKEVVKHVPIILDYICDNCRDHFEKLKIYLSAAGLQLNINPFIVRGLDYYTKTVFEIIYSDSNSNLTICGGGRYDELVEECGGPKMPGAGFGMGIERLLMVLEDQGIIIPDSNNYDVYFISIGDQSRERAFQLTKILRDNNIAADMDHIGRSVKSQFKYADKMSIPWVCVLGDEEINNNNVKVKEMSTGSENYVFMEDLVDFFRKKLNIQDREE